MLYSAARLHVSVFVYIGSLVHDFPVRVLQCLHGSVFSSGVAYFVGGAATGDAIVKFLGCHAAWALRDCCPNSVQSSSASFIRCGSVQQSTGGVIHVCSGVIHPFNEESQSRSSVLWGG